MPEGGVRKAANRMRISVQRVKVVDRCPLWPETCDRTLEDILAVQDDIAQSALKELRTTLPEEAPGGMTGGGGDGCYRSSCSSRAGATRRSRRR